MTRPASPAWRLLSFVLCGSRVAMAVVHRGRGELNAPLPEARAAGSVAIRALRVLRHRHLSSP